MKKLLTRFAIIAVALVAAATASAQLKVTLHVTHNPPPYLSDWTNRKDVTVVTVLNSGAKSVDAKFDCKVYKDGVLQAQTKPESMRTITLPPGLSQWFGEDLVPFEAVKFFGSSDQTAAKTGTLPSGNYSFCVSLLDPTTLKQLTAPVCQDFFITSYQAPTLIEPANKATLGRNARPMFRWTAVTPPTQALYHLQVFEVLKGQTPITAYKVNRPILDQSDLRVTQFLWPADYDLPQPGMQYVWGVRATDASGNPLGEINGVGGPAWFTVGGAGGRGDTTGSNGNNDGLNGSNSGGTTGMTGSHFTSGSNTQKDTSVVGSQPFTQAAGGGAQAGLTAVTPKPNARLSTKDRKPTFSWAWSKEPPGVAAYEFTLTANESKKEIHTELHTKETPWPSGIAYAEGGYTWSVVALGQDGSQIGSTGSQNFSVMSNNYQIQYSVDSLLCTDSIGKYRFVVTLCNTGVLPITFTPSDLTALDDITGLPDPNIVLTVTTPSSMVTLNAPNCITISGTLRNLGTKMTGILKIHTKRVGGNILAADETENDTLPTCLCTKCDSIKIDTTGAKAQIDPKTGQLIITQPLAAGPGTLTGLTADIIYVSWKPDDPKCIPCDKDPKQWGVLTQASFDAAPKPIIQPNEAQWTLDGTHNTGLATFYLSLPQVLDCCKLHVALCIRYKFYFTDPSGECYECERVICYSI